MRRVVIDANVFLSTLVHRNDARCEAAKALLLKAEHGELEVILPQFVVFEIVYVLQSTYRIPDSELAPMLRDLITLPGVLVVDECPWKRILEYWPTPSLPCRRGDRRRRREQPIRRDRNLRPEAPQARKKPRLATYW